MESNPVRIEELLAHAGWVRKLAGRLVRDAGTADDVSQEVWAHALRSPPRDRSNLRAWLSAAVRNSVRSLKRAEVRRADREAVVEVRDEDPATSEIVERAQLHRHLVEQVLALEEPHRAIVLAHWFEEHSLAEIARRQQLTERVVKARLVAGHELLRQRMDKISGGRGAWCLAFTQWLGPNLAPTGAGAALTVGGLFVASKLVIGSVAAVVVVMAAWWLWPTFEAQPIVASAGNAPETRMLDPITRTNELVQANTGSAREALALAVQSTPISPATATPTRWVVRGHVRGAPAGREHETQLSARFIGRYVIEDTAIAQVASDGGFEIDVTAPAMRWLREAEPNEIQVSAQHPLCMRAQTQMPFASANRETTSPSEVRVYRCDFTLAPAAIVIGRLVVPQGWTPALEYGKPQLPRVGLFFFSRESRFHESLDYSECDELGNWTLRVSRSGLFTVIGYAESLLPAPLDVELTVGQTTDAGTLELVRGESISGTVRRAGASVEAGVSVVAESKERATTFSVPSSADHASTLFRSDHAIGPARISTLTRADGSYSLDGLLATEYDLYVDRVPDVRASSGGQQHVERTLRAPQSGIDLGDIPPTVELALRVGGRAATNAELDGVKLAVVWPSWAPGALHIELTNSADGYGKIQLEPGIEHELRLESGRYTPTVVPISPLAFGEARTVTVDLVPQDRSSTLVVRLVTEEPQVVEAVEIAVQSLSPDSDPGLAWNRVRSSERNTFVIRDQVPGRYLVNVRSGEAFATSAPVYFLPAAFEVVLPAKATVERELRPLLGGRMRVSLKNERGDYLFAKAELRDAQREQIETGFWCLTERGLFGCGWCISERGINDHPPLPAGHYELTLIAEGFAQAVLPFELVQGETKSLDVVLHPR